MTYTLTDGDRQIFALAQSNANFFTDFYLRSPKSGTYWLPDDENEDRLQAYELLYQMWVLAGKPPKQLTVEQEDGTRITYLIEPHVTSYPVFHHNHGFLFMPWQLEFHHCSQNDITVIGGFGSSKTTAGAMSLLVNAARLRGFRGAFMAQVSYQANQAYEITCQIMADTPFSDRFLEKTLSRPPATIRLAHNGIGRSQIVYQTIKEASNILSLEFDMVVVDQAELFGDLRSEVIIPVGSRLRGVVQGRPRLGRFALLANSGDNPQLWDRFDDARLDPKNMRSFQISTYDNIYLTQRQIADYKRRIAQDAQSEDQYLRGQRPPGMGKHFPIHVLDLCRDTTLEDINRRGMEHDEAGYTYEEARRVALHNWSIPPLPHARHLLVADPGWDNPPDRNSAVLMVWDITHFPDEPASMRAFRWVFGNNRAGPWLEAYMEYLSIYRCDQHFRNLQLEWPKLEPGYNAFDATGLQKGYDELVFDEYGVVPDTLSMAGANKFALLNHTKVLMGRGLLKMPYIPHLWNQCMNYRLPDTKLRQDIVMALIMSGGWLVRAFGLTAEETEQFVRSGITDRYARKGVRYGGRSEWVDYPTISGRDLPS